MLFGRAIEQMTVINLVAHKKRAKQFKENFPCYFLCLKWLYGVIEVLFIIQIRFILNGQNHIQNEAVCDM